MLARLRKYQFLFEELVKRDFKKKYKRTVLGMGWSVLMPLLTLLVMKVVFEQFFGRNMLHYTTYLFCGNMFLFSGSIQTLINFMLTLCVFFVFCALDHVTFTWRFAMLVYPILTLLVFNMGIGLILSALYMFFRDLDYLWGVFLQLLMYGSAIFYTIDKMPAKAKLVFAFNPVYRHIAYFREIVLSASVPSLETHLTLGGFAIVAFTVGAWMYRHYNTRFLYYV